MWRVSGHVSDVCMTSLLTSAHRTTQKDKVSAECDDDTTSACNFGPAYLFSTSQCFHPTLYDAFELAGNLSRTSLHTISATYQICSTLTKYYDFSCTDFSSFLTSIFISM